MHLSLCIQLINFLLHEWNVYLVLQYSVKFFCSACCFSSWGSWLNLKGSSYWNSQRGVCFNCTIKICDLLTLLLLLYFHAVKFLGITSCQFRIHKLYYEIYFSMNSRSYGMKRYLTEFLINFLKALKNITHSIYIFFYRALQ